MTKVHLLFLYDLAQTDQDGDPTHITTSAHATLRAAAASVVEHVREEDADLTKYAETKEDIDAAREVLQNRNYDAIFDSLIGSAKWWDDPVLEMRWKIEEHELNENETY